GNAGLLRDTDQFVEPADAVGGFRVSAEVAFQPVEDFGVGSLRLGEVEQARRLYGGDAGFFRHLRGDSVGADLRKFVERPQQRRRVLREADLFEQSVQNETIVDVNREALDADRLEQVVNDQGNFDVGGVRRRADGVEVALPELAEAAALRVL